MTTPLGLARQLRLSFPEFLEIRMVRERAFSLRAYCAIASLDRRVPDARIAEWIRAHSMAGTVLAIDQVLVLPKLVDDEEALLRRTNVSRLIAESADTTGPGTVRTLRELFPDEFVDVSTTSGCIAIHVTPSTPVTRDQEILDSARLLMICDAQPLAISRQAPPTRNSPRSMSAESTMALQQIDEDIARLHQLLPDVLSSEQLGLPALPVGSATYASPHDGVDSLLQRLALFEHVYVYVPLKIEDFGAWVGSPFDEFLDVLPTGRVIPLFAQALDRYEGGLMSRILDSGPPRVVLRGEHTLRSVRSFVKDHSALSAIESDEGSQLRVALANETDENVVRLLHYFDALAQIASRLPFTVVSGQPLESALFPLAAWIDGIRRQFGHPPRDLEIVAALEHRAATEAIGGAPMVATGHYLDSGLRFVYGAEPGSSDVLRIPDPKMIGRICFPDTTGLTLRTFAETFRGPSVDAMRELMASPRVQTADGNTDLVNAFNRELQVYSRRADNRYTMVATVLAAVGVFALSAPTALAGLSLELARRVMGRKAPGAMATFASKMTGATREAALLARIQRQ